MRDDTWGEKYERAPKKFGSLGDKALQLVAPNAEVKMAYLKKSESYLASARLLRDSERSKSPYR